MTSDLTPAHRTVVLVVGLEPWAPRPRIEGALVLLGLRAASLDEAIGRGLVVQYGDRVDVSDPRLLRVVAQRAREHERRTAHLALACAGGRRDTARTRRAFDSLISALDEGPAGATPPPAGPSPGRLTTQERRIAELAATGVPVAEIARASFLSQKTVEHYLTRVYRKLGVRSKAELACSFRAS